MGFVERAIWFQPTSSFLLGTMRSLCSSKLSKFDLFCLLSSKVSTLNKGKGREAFFRVGVVANQPMPKPTSSSYIKNSNQYAIILNMTNVLGMYSNCIFCDQIVS